MNRSVLVFGLLAVALVCAGKAKKDVRYFI